MMTLILSIGTLKIYHQLETYFVTCNWNSIYRLTNVEDQLCALNTNIKNLYDKHVPHKC